MQENLKCLKNSMRFLNPVKSKGAVLDISLAEPGSH